MSSNREVPHDLRGLSASLRSNSQTRRENGRPTDIATADHIENSLNELVEAYITGGNMHFPLAKAIIAYSHKQHSRYFVDKFGNKYIDTQSTQWTTGTNVTLNALNGIAQFVPTDLNIKLLDPFGGAGSLSHAMSIYFPNSSIICSDIAYSDGVPIIDQMYYSPANNSHALRRHIATIFPEQFHPKLNNVDYRQIDATQLSLFDNSVDFVITDPPYGINLDHGGASFFINVIPEFLRVSKYGGFFIIPTSWHEALLNNDIAFTVIYPDLTIGPNGQKMSNLERSLICIAK